MSLLKPVHGQRSQQKFWEPIRIILFSLFVLVLLAGFYLARWAVLTAIIGLGIGVLLSPVMQFLTGKLKLPRGLGALAIAMVLFAAAGLLVYFITTLVAGELVPVLSNLPSALDSLKEKLLERFGEAHWIRQGLHKFNANEYLRRSISPLLEGIQFSVAALGGVIFIVALSLYFTVDSERYLSGFLKFFPKHLREEIEVLCHKAGRTLRKWFVTQVIAVLIVGSITALGLWSLGVDSWALLGGITAICEVVPFLGPLFATAIACLVTFGTEPEKVLWVIALFTAVQQLEGNLITPLVLKEGINLPPVPLLVLMLLMWEWFGILGVLITPATFAVGRMIFLTAYVPRMNARTRPASPEKPRYSPTSAEGKKKSA